MEDNKELQITQQNEEEQQEEAIKQEPQKEVPEPRTFTQEEVDEIIKTRIARDRRNRPGNAGLRERERDLEARENQLYARERFLNEGLPSDLMSLVTGKNKEDIDKTIDTLKPYVNKAKEPILNPAAHTSWGERMGASYSRPDRVREAMGLNHRKG